MDPYTIISALLAAAAEMWNRAQQNGTLSKEQAARLSGKAEGVFSIYEHAEPPPPPPGV